MVVKVNLGLALHCYGLKGPFLCSPVEHGKLPNLYHMQADYLETGSNSGLSAHIVYDFGFLTCVWCHSCCSQSRKSLLQILR